MNRKGVEGLPLKYIIIAIVAALVVGVLIQVTGTIGQDVTGAAVRLNNTLADFLNSSGII